MTVNYDTTASDMFNSAFTEAVETALSVLGDATKQVVYWYIFNSKTGLGAKALSQPEAFTRSLQKLLGKGADRIEEIVLSELSARLGLALNEHGGTFIQSVASLKESMGRPN
jgi:tRNA A37 threonylcarbamoyladenosine modification protein TsaB